MKTIKLSTLITGILFAVTLTFLIIFVAAFAKDYEFTHILGAGFTVLSPGLFMTLFFISLSILIIMSKGHWTKWIAFVFTVLFTLIGGLYCVAGSMGLKDYAIYKNARVLYENVQDKDIKIVEQVRETKSGTKHRTVLTLGKPILILQKTKAYGYQKLVNGKWYAIGEKNTPIYVAQMEDGKEVWRDENIERGLQDALVITRKDDLTSIMATNYDGKTIRIIGYIELDDNWLIENRKNIVIQGMDVHAGIAISSQNKPVITLTDCENITIENLKLSHVNGTYDNINTIDIEACKNITLLKNSLLGNASVGVNLLDNCESIEVSNNVIHDFRTAAIKGDGKKLTIKENTFYHNGPRAEDDIKLVSSNNALIENNNHRIVFFDHDIEDMKMGIETGQYISSGYSTNPGYPGNIDYTFHYNDSGSLVHVKAIHSDSVRDLYILSANKRYYHSEYKIDNVDGRDGEVIDITKEYMYYILNDNLVLMEELGPTIDNRYTYENNPDEMMMSEEGINADMYYLIAEGSNMYPVDDYMYAEEDYYDGEYPPGYYEGDAPPGYYEGEMPPEYYDEGGSPVYYGDENKEF